MSGFFCALDTIRRRLRLRHQVRLHVPAIFRFRETERACPYWRLDGEHRVAHGKCRCGKQFVIGERVEGPKG